MTMISLKLASSATPATFSEHAADQICFSDDEILIYQPDNPFYSVLSLNKSSENIKKSAEVLQPAPS